MTASEFRDRRQSLLFSQADLASKLGVHITTVSRWERGTRRIPEPIARFVLLLRAKRLPSIPQADLSTGSDGDDKFSIP